MPLKAWVKGVLDEIVQVCLKQPDLEFAWVGDDAVDPLQQAQTLSLLVGAGIKTREEARAELGLVPATRVGGATVAKFNPYHDERGRFTTPDGAIEPGEGGAPASSGEKPPAGVEVADIDPRLANPGVMSDAPPTPVAPDANATSSENPPGIVGSVEFVDPQGDSVSASPTSDFTDETSTIWQIARRLASAAIETLGAGVTEATAAASAVAGAILVSSATSTGDPNYGVVPGRPDVSFEWNPVTGKIQFFRTGQSDQTGRTPIADGQIGNVPGVFLDSRQRILALEVKHSGGYVLANLGLLDEAIAALRSPGEAPQAADNSGAQGDALQVFYNPTQRRFASRPSARIRTGRCLRGLSQLGRLGPARAKTVLRG